MLHAARLPQHLSHNTSHNTSHNSNAQAVALVGEFNDWEPKENHWAVRNEFGTWELFMPDGRDGTPSIWHR